MVLRRKTLRIRRRSSLMSKGLPGCGDQAPCPMHYRWKHWKASIRSEFESTTLADLKEPELLKHLRWAT